MNSKLTSSARTAFVVSTAIFLAVVPALSIDLANNGVFRFATQDLPVGSTNTEYVTRVLVANADGPVTYSVDLLANGLSLDSGTGFITGRPTSTFNQDITITADDGVSMIDLVVNLQVNSSGGGGNAGATVSTTVLAQGEVGTAYSQTLTVSDGTGPFTFGATSLPPGLSLDGQSGEISGVPVSAGTYYARISVLDAGDGDNNVVTILPLTILPDGATFQFTTFATNSGEVGTPYCDSYGTSGASGNVRFSVSGLPPGLTLDSTSGVVSGTPTVAGTYDLFLSVTDNSDTISTNMSLTVLSSASSNFYWDVFALPNAIVDVQYTRQPPILVAARNGASVTYAADGLPAGISYNTSTGELTGTATEIGVYPATFTANDAGSNETITLTLDFVVLPSTGGDTNGIAVGFWSRKQKVNTGSPGSDLWKGILFYNDDRTAAGAFDPATDAMVLTLGARAIEVDAGEFFGSEDAYVWASPDGESPKVAVKFLPKRQIVLWKSKADTLNDTVPSQLRHTLALGNRTYRLDGFFDEKGTLKSTGGYRTAAFVAFKGKFVATGADSMKLGLLLADPTFSYTSGDTLRLRILDGDTALVDKDFTEFGTVSLGVDKFTGGTAYTIKAVDADSVTDRIRFVYKSVKGKTVVKLSAADLSAIAAAEIHLGVELTIGDHVYLTRVTFFETKSDVYSLRKP